MILQLENYKMGFRIVSLSLNEDTKTDLLEDNLSFIHIDSDGLHLYPEDIIISTDEEILNSLTQCSDYDVFELSDSGRLRWCYDVTSIDNYFFLTSRCNSNCVMCPSAVPTRKTESALPMDYQLELARHIPSDAAHLTITGGEPFLVGEEIFPFFKFLSDKFTDTEFLVLTNGRAFALEKYIRMMKESVPRNCVFAIPLHGSNAELHDSVTRSKGSFAQTLTGINKALAAGFRVELRIVVSRLNCMDFTNLVRLVIDKIPKVEYVSVIAMEMTGNAAVNRDKLWLPYTKIAAAISNGVITLIESGIDTRLYNFPLCTVERRFWPIVCKSISPEKVRYTEKCPQCRYRNSCGGLFAGTIKLEREEVNPIL